MWNFKGVKRKKKKALKMPNNSKPKVGDIFTDTPTKPDKRLISVCIIVDQYSYITLFKDGTLIHSKTVELNDFRLIEQVPFDISKALEMSKKAVDLCNKAINKKNIKP